ncbi:hypothetical protein HMPREF9372_2830 [Sporosarcina newyorkensis 2681]|uniref:Uncharacterized protein n=1 Tax=Sporosarcina newyorkensis 2681 TaxID=1027292 RepID=F9DVJ9_9BACL|nr:hypothetical protein HMPREF9372_2830 [Sporosarcina newyorkensis 2681]
MLHLKSKLRVDKTEILFWDGNMSKDFFRPFFLLYLIRGVFSEWNFCVTQFKQRNNHLTFTQQHDF